MHRTRHSISIPTSVKSMRFWRVEIKDDEKSLIFYDPNTLTKKKTKRKASRQERFFEIIFSFNQPVKLNSATIFHDSREIRLTGRIDSPIILFDSILYADQVEIKHYYVKHDGRQKPLSAFYMSKEAPPANINMILSRYEYFFAIDTNTTIPTSPKAISVTTIVRGSIDAATRDHSIFRYDLYESFMFEGVEDNPEFYALSVLMKAELSKLPENFIGKVGFITDSHLGDIKSINSREIPLYEDFYLPECFELMYASAERASEEFVPNAMITACELNSKKILKNLPAEKPEREDFTVLNIK